ncbi:MAG: alpha-hydroxy-acid oxidizing protein [Rhizobiales bacterium]|nr:alpha-hydroxy-acid oxidizing protein [Hyphomicrobiales bacterium]
MRVQEAISVVDLERLAKRRLPRILFECIQSGVEDESGVARNSAGFHQHQLLPRHLVDVKERDQSTTIFGRTYASPFGISPTGIAELFRRGADLMLAQAAAGANVPSIMSGSSMTAPETISKVVPNNPWYQLYAARDPSISDDFVRRARDCGFQTLVLTVDNPVFPKLERDKRNGFSVPFRLTLPIMLDALRRPGWTFEYLRNGGMPMMHTWAPYAPAGATAAEVSAFRRTQNPSVQTWRDLDRFRRLWPGNLVVKGLARPSDAVRAANAGVDGIIVSNHGGKTLDRAPATADALVGIAAAVGDKIVVMLDSGVRRGSDIVVGLCLGAKFVFVGRATLYGVAAGGMAGARRALDILREELDMTLAMIGCPNVAELGPDFLFNHQRREDNRFGGTQ